MMKKQSAFVLRALIALGLATAVWTRSTEPVAAQAGVTITSPALNAVFAEGPDFMSDTLSDPWDFNNRADVALDPAQIGGWSVFNVNGSVGGTTNALGANFSILQRAWWGILNPGRTGRRYPISTSIYTKLSLKMSASAAGQHPRVIWFHNDIGDPAGDASGERYFDPANASPSGTSLQVMDLTQSLRQGAAWNSGAFVKGLALYPNENVASENVSFDWVRLTTPDGHPAGVTMPIRWSGFAGATTIKVTDASGAVYTVTTTATGGAYDYNYGVLPPGNYTLTVGTATRTFTVNARPSIQITDPDETGGDDFATTVLGNPWDMQDQADVERNVNIVDHLIAPTFSGGLFTATSDGQTVGFAGPIPVGDPQMYLLSNQKTSNTTDIIDTSKYHRLTFSLQVDHPFNLQTGSVARVFWGSASSASGGGTPYNVTTSKDIITWPGMNTYSIDLAPLNAGPDGGLEPANATPWTAQPVRHFRLDPFEFAEQVTFHYGPVKLAADDETKGGKFTVRWTGSDPDDVNDTVALFYDTDTNPSTGLVSIGNVALSAGQFVWNTSGVPAGTYFVYAVATDGHSSVGRYSTGPVKVSNLSSPSSPAMNVDAPAASSVVTSAFEVGGWAIDRGAASGTGVDSVVFYIFPNGGAGAPVYVGTGSYGSNRTDVASAFGPQFANSAFHFTITGLGPGAFVLGVYPHSTVTNSFTAPTLIPLTVSADTLMSIDAPSPEATITTPTFGIGGWAIDRRAPTGTGVGALHVYAYPNAGAGQAIFLGVATMGISRPDVGSLYGSRFNTSGYVLNVTSAAKGLTPGVYNIVVWAQSTFTGTFTTNAVVRVTIR
jgi:hypothetical protein